MGNDPIYCFNRKPEDVEEMAGQCVYKECPMFSEELDLCKLELLKSKPKKATTERKPIRDEPQRKPELGDKTMICDLKPEDKSSKEQKINIEGEVVYEPKINNTTTGKLVCNLVLKDESGQISLAFWDDDTKKVMGFAVGDKVRVENIWKIDEPYEGNSKGSPGKWAKVIKL